MRVRQGRPRPEPPIGPEPPAPTLEVMRRTSDRLSATPDDVSVTVTRPETVADLEGWSVTALRTANGDAVNVTAYAVCQIWSP